jgi:hypothetical protein
MLSELNTRNVLTNMLLRGASCAAFHTDELISVCRTAHGPAHLAAAIRDQLSSPGWGMLLRLQYLHVVARQFTLQGYRRRWLVEGCTYASCSPWSALGVARQSIIGSPARLTRSGSRHLGYLPMWGYYRAVRDEMIASVEVD